MICTRRTMALIKIFKKAMFCINAHRLQPNISGCFNVMVVEMLNMELQAKVIAIFL